MIGGGADCGSTWAKRPGAGPRRGELGELLGEQPRRAARHQHQLGHAGEVAIVEREVIPGLGLVVGDPQGVVDRVGRVVRRRVLARRAGVVDPLGPQQVGISRRRRDLLGVAVAGIQRRLRGGPAGRCARRDGDGVAAAIGLEPLGRIDRVRPACRQVGDRRRPSRRALAGQGRGAVDIGEAHGVDDQHGIGRGHRGERVGGPAQADPVILRLLAPRGHGGELRLIAGRRGPRGGAGVRDDPRQHARVPGDLRRRRAH